MLSYSFWCHIRWGWTAGWVWGGGGEWGYSWLIRSSLFRRWKEHRASLAGCPCLIIQTHPLSDSHSRYIRVCLHRQKQTCMITNNIKISLFLPGDSNLFLFSFKVSILYTFKALFSSLKVTCTISLTFSISEPKVTRGWSHQPALLASKLWVLALINIPIKSQENLNPKRTGALDFLIKRPHPRLSLGSFTP